MPSYYFLLLKKGYKAELVLTDTSAVGYSAFNDPKIYHAGGKYYIYQSQNKPKLISGTHANYSSTSEQAPGFFLLYTRYGQEAKNLPGRVTGGVMTMEELIADDVYHWTGEEILQSSLPADILTNSNYVVPRSR